MHRLTTGAAHGVGTSGAHLATSLASDRGEAPRALLTVTQNLRGFPGTQAARHVGKAGGALVMPSWHGYFVAGHMACVHVLVV